MDPSSSPDQSQSQNGVKKFKSQSLNSMFLKTAAAGGVSPSNSPSPSADSKAKSPKPASSTTISLTSTPKKAVTSLSTASGTYKLAAMKKDRAAGSPSSSNNNSPRTEPATVWKKVGDEPSVTSPSAKDQVNSAAVPSVSVAHSAHSTQSTHTESTQSTQTPQTTQGSQTAHKDEPKANNDISEEELVKKGIFLAQRLSTSEASHREFNWDEDDDDDDDWQPSAELVAKVQEAKEASAKSQPSSVADSAAAQKQSSSSAASQAPKPAPWSLQTQEKRNVVSIGDQIKELSQKKHQKQQAHQQQFQNVPRYNYRMSNNPNWQSHEDRERYRYHDHEQRYRTDAPPRQELFNASSGQMEMLDHDPHHHPPPTQSRYRRFSNSSAGSSGGGTAGGGGGGARRYSNDRSISPQSWRSGPSRHEMMERQKEMREQRMREMEQQRIDEEKREEEYRAQQAEVMRQAREKARKRKEEELRLEEERKEAARKKASEVAQRIAEKQKEQERKEKERLEKAKKEREAAAAAAEAVKKAAAIAEEKSTPSRPRNQSIGRHRTHSIGEKQALEAVESVLDDDDDEGGKKIWTTGTATPSKIWSQSNRSQNDVGNVWGSVRVSTSRFSSGLYPAAADDMFKSKDDMALKKEQHVWNGGGADAKKTTKEWSVPTTQSQPVTPSAAVYPATTNTATTPENRGYSRFFPSPQIESNNKAGWGSNGSPKMLRESLLPSNGNHFTNTNTNNSNNNNRSGSTSLSTPSTRKSSPPPDESPSSPRVVLPPKLDSARRVQSIQSDLPVPGSPEVGGPRNQPFPLLAREAKKQAAKPKLKATPPVIKTSNLEALIRPKNRGKPVTRLPSVPIEQEVSKFEMFPKLEPVQRGNEELVAHLSHYRDKDGNLHRREYEIDYGKPLSTWLIRLPGCEKRTILTRDDQNVIKVGEPPKRPPPFARPHNRHHHHFGGRRKTVK